MTGPWDEALRTAAWWSGEVGEAPSVAVVLGSGLGGVADRVEDPWSATYANIPGMPAPSVQGHGGRMVVGRLPGSSARVAVMAGRTHLYEGASARAVCHGVRALRAWGVEAVLLTNAAGGVREGLRPGDLVQIVDHLNLTGVQPLVGPEDPRMGPRFPDLGRCWDPGWTARIGRVAERVGVPVQRGVYAQMMGPGYETPAEVRMVRVLGADLVGMSTVVEAIAAHHVGLRVAGLSCVTNLAAGMTDDTLTHDEVQETADRVAGDVERLVLAVLEDEAGSGERTSCS